MVGVRVNVRSIAPAVPCAQPAAPRSLPSQPLTVTWISPLLRFLVQLGYITEITETLLLALGDFYAKMLASVVLMQVCIIHWYALYIPTHAKMLASVVLMQVAIRTYFCM